MRLVAGQRYIKGPHGEIMPYSPAMEKITGCVVFTQDKDFVDGMQLRENENMQRYSGRRSVEVKAQESHDTTDAKPEVVLSRPQTQPQVQVKKVVKPVPQKKVFEAEFDLRDDMAADLKENTSGDIAELD